MAKAKISPIKHPAYWEFSSAVCGGHSLCFGGRLKDWAILEILKTTHGASQALGTSSRGVDLGCPQTIRENGNYPHLLLQITFQGLGMGKNKHHGQQSSLNST